MKSYLDGVVHGVLHELCHEFLVNGCAVIDRGVSQLLEDVIEARRPLARPQARGDRAVVHHERHTLESDYRTSYEAQNARDVNVRN